MLKTILAIFAFASLLSTVPAHAYRLFDEAPNRWTDDQINIYINIAGSPWSPVTLQDALLYAIGEIEKYASIDLNYRGLTDTTPATNFTPALQGSHIVHVGELANNFSDTELWWSWADKGIIDHTQTILDPDVDAGCLRGAMVHELVHVLFIRHSDVPESIMFADPYHSCQYQETLRKDDIEALGSLYPPQANNETKVIGQCPGEGFAVYVPRIRHGDIDVSFEFCLTPEAVLNVWEN